MKSIRVAFIAVFLCGQAFANEPANLEYQVKAAFILNFAKFVEWPPSSFPETGTPLVIGIYGANPFGDALEQIASTQKLDGRTIVVRRSDNLEELAKSHVLFIHSTDEKTDGEALDRLRGLGVLTIGEEPGFLQRGGMINFVLRENKVRFEINLAAAEKASLKISSKLLNLAQTVVRSERL